MLNEEKPSRIVEICCGRRRTWLQLLELIRSKTLSVKKRIARWRVAFVLVNKSAQSYPRTVNI